FFQAEDGIRDFHVTGVQTCALPISIENAHLSYGNIADYEFTWYRGSTHFTDIIAGVDEPILDKNTYPQIGADTYYVTATIVTSRSEERRVGKECRYRR